eukprot:521789-Prymnesium_polylepis.1
MRRNRLFTAPPQAMPPSLRRLALPLLCGACAAPASAMRLVLIRHAQSANNVAASEERSRTDISAAEAQENFERRRVEDPSLSELGSRQAEELGAMLAADGELARYAESPICVYCSPMQRT